MSAPVAQEELPILESLINIRNRLTALKKDRGDYIKASDVNSLYQSVVKQVTKLNDVRDDERTYNNRVDATLADVFSLLSLFFLTIGKTRDAVAAYSQIASMRQILNHMSESGVYNESDLAPFSRRLQDLRSIVMVDASQAKHGEALTKLLERQLNECDAIVRSLEESLAVLSVELVPVHEKLVTIRRQLVALAAKQGSHKAELKPIQEELRRIDSFVCFFLLSSVYSYILRTGNELTENSWAQEAFSLHHRLFAHLS
jgi:chromosome segregation ATPase